MYVIYYIIHRLYFIYFIYLILGIFSSQIIFIFYLQLLISVILGYWKIIR